MHEARSTAQCMLCANNQSMICCHDNYLDDVEPGLGVLKASSVCHIVHNHKCICSSKIDCSEGIVEPMHRKREEGKIEEGIEGGGGEGGGRRKDRVKLK